VSQRTVVVIGSNSFSGSDFIDLLLDDPRTHVVGISRSPEKSALFLPYKHRKNPSFSFYQMDLNKDIPTMVDLLDSLQPESIVNFAAQSEVAPSWDHPEHWYLTNVVALAKLTNTLRTRKYLKRYMHISSPEAYGAFTDRITEEAPLLPSTPYAASKAAADQFLSTLVKGFGFPVVTIRATNVYGAHQQLWKIIPRSIVYIKMGKKIQLHGGGTAVKSYIHIRDVSRGELAALERGRVGQVYHLSPDRGYAVRDVVANICRLMGRKFEESTISVEQRLGQDPAYVIESTRARSEFGWRPQVELEEGLRGVVSWVENNWHEIEKQPKEYVHQA
jgi:dTDP-glucose 4,6-dehydratase